MNVLFITTCTTLLGANRAMLTQIQHLKSKGVVPIVLLPFDGEITLKLKEQNVEYCVHKFKTFKIRPRNKSLYSYTGSQLFKAYILK